MGHGLEENGQEIILNADNAEQCQIKCQETSYCVGITYVHEWQKCHLKHIIPGSSFDTGNIGTVSGPKYCGNITNISYQHCLYYDYKPTGHALVIRTFDF